MLCPHCKAQLEEGATFCGNCGNKIVPLQASDVTVANSVGSAQPSTNRGNPLWDTYSTRQDEAQLPTIVTGPRTPPFNTPVTPAQAPPQISARPKRNTGRIVLFAALILLLVAGTIGVAAFLNKNTPNTPVVASGTTGLVSFLDSANGQGHTDALKINVSGLSTPSSGTQYSAWLVNENEQILPLGTLSQQNQTFSLDYKGDGKGTNLLGAGNKIEITQEQGNVSVPTGKVVLVGSFPPLAFFHIRHLLFSFPTTPGQQGLLVGLLDQAQQLNTQAILVKNAADNQKFTTLGCLAQNIVNIAEGAQGTHFQHLGDACHARNINEAGDGFGLLGTNGYIATAATHASLAATQTDSTDNIKVHAGHVRIAMDNLKGWVSTIEKDALSLVTNSNDNAKVTEVVSLADRSLNGIDLDGDERVDPVPGEAGAITAYTHGHLMAALTLKP